LVGRKTKKLADGFSESSYMQCLKNGTTRKQLVKPLELQNNVKELKEIMALFKMSANPGETEQTAVETVTQRGHQCQQDQENAVGDSNKQIVIGVEGWITSQETVLR
jgi:hypothetical protein